MKQFPDVVRKFFTGTELMVDDWEIEQFESQLEWMLFDCNERRDELDRKASEIIEALETLGDYKEERREKAFQLHQSDRGFRSLF